MEYLVQVGRSWQRAGRLAPLRWGEGAQSGEAPWGARDYTESTTHGRRGGICLDREKTTWYLFTSPLTGPASQCPGPYKGRNRLVNAPPVAHREDPENPVATVEGIDDAKAPHAVLPESLQFPHERLIQGGIATESLEGTLDRSLQLRRKMLNDRCHMG